MNMCVWKKIVTYCLLMLCLCLTTSIFAQKKSDLSFFEPADTFHKGRYWLLNGGFTTVSTGVFVGLNELWYKGYEKTSFHLFNDYGEWEHIDKVGHLFTAYSIAKWGTEAYRWAGVPKRKAVWAGVVLSSTFQGSIELLDGFSAKWGASLPDIAFNTMGVAMYAGQEFLWEEQRIITKYSTHQTPYSKVPIESFTHAGEFMTLEERAFNLYGSSLFEVMFKDYNSTTQWFSANIHAFLPKETQKKTKFPKWLNVAFGYGAENMYGGFENEWENENGALFRADPTLFPRHRQYLLSFDVDFGRIKTKSKFWNAAFVLLNALKVPAPTLEWTSHGKFRVIPVYF